MTTGETILVDLFLCVFLVVGFFCTSKTERAFQYWARFQWWGWYISTLGQPQFMPKEAKEYFEKAFKDPNQFPVQMLMVRLVGIVMLFVSGVGLIMSIPAFL